MSPGEFDPQVVQSRLLLMDGVLDDLASAGTLDGVRLSQERMLRYAVERMLAQLVDLAVSVNSHVSATLLGKSPRDYRTSFGLLAEAGAIDPALAERLKPSVGLRNILAHEYVDVDLGIVAAAAAMALRDFRAYVRSVSAWLSQR